MSDAKTPNLPPLVGTLLTLPPHVQEVVKTYGAACGRMATVEANARVAALEERVQFLLAATRDAQDHAAAYGAELLTARSAPPSHEGEDARDAVFAEFADFVTDHNKEQPVPWPVAEMFVRHYRAARAGGSQ